MQPGNGGEAAVNPGLVLDMLKAHQRTAALKAAIDLDVFAPWARGRAMWPRSRATAPRRSAASASFAISW